MPVRTARHNHQPGGGHVEPVHDERIGVTDLHPRAQAIRLAGTATRHRQQTAWLVEDQQSVVDVEGGDGGERRHAYCHAWVIRKAIGVRRVIVPGFRDNHRH